MASTSRGQRPIPRSPRIPGPVPPLPSVHGGKTVVSRAGLVSREQLRFRPHAGQPTAAATMNSEWLLPNPVVPSDQVTESTDRAPVEVADHLLHLALAQGLEENEGESLAQYFQRQETTGRSPLPHPLQQKGLQPSGLQSALVVHPSLAVDEGMGLPLISSWPSNNPSRESHHRPQLLSRTSVRRKLGASSSLQEMMPSPTAKEVDLFVSQSKAVIVQELESFLAVECARHRPLAARSDRLCDGLQRVGEVASTFAPCLRQMQLVVQSIAQEYKQLEATSESKLQAAVTGAVSERQEFYEKALRLALADKRRALAELERTKREAADQRDLLEKEIHEAKVGVWGAIQKVQEDHTQEASMRQLLASVYRTNAELRDEVSYLRQTLSDLGAGTVAPSAAFQEQTTATTDRSKGKGLSAGKTDGSSKPGAGTNATVSGGNTVEQSSFSLKPLTLQVPPQFIEASRKEMSQCRLATQKALIDAASDTKSGYKLMLDHANAENQTLKERVKSLEEQLDVLERYFHAKRFLWGDIDPWTLPQEERVEFERRAKTPRPSIPYDIQTSFGISLKGTTREIVEELSSVALRLLTENRDLSIRNRKQALCLNWVDSRAMKDCIEEMGGYQPLLQTIVDDDWSTLQHFLRTDVRPSVPNLGWSQEGIFNLCSLFFDNLDWLAAEAQHFSDRRTCAVPIVPQWERRRFALQPPLDPMKVGGAEHLLSKPSGFAPTISALGPNFQSLDNLSIRSATEKEEFAGNSRVATPSVGAHTTTKGDGGEEAPVDPYQAIRFVPVGYMVSVFLKKLLESRWNGSQPEQITQKMIAPSPTVGAGPSPLHGVGAARRAPTSDQDDQRSQRDRHGDWQSDNTDGSADEERTTSTQEPSQHSIKPKVYIDQLLFTTVAYNFWNGLIRFRQSEPQAELLLQALEGKVPVNLVRQWYALLESLREAMNEADAAKSGYLTRKAVASTMVSTFQESHPLLWKPLMSYLHSTQPKATLADHADRLRWKQLLIRSSDCSKVLCQYVVRSYVAFTAQVIAVIEPLVQESVVKPGLLVLKFAAALTKCQEIDANCDRRVLGIPPLRVCSFAAHLTSCAELLPRLNASVHLSSQVSRNSSNSKLPVGGDESAKDGSGAMVEGAVEADEANLKKISKKRSKKFSSGQLSALRNDAEKLSQAKNDRELLEWYQLCTLVRILPIRN